MSEQASAPDLAFESALARLEQILEKMNTGAVSLEDALKLYEEADRLISTCNKKLHEAERKIEMITKNRTKEALGPDGKPLTEPFPFNGK